MVLDWLAKGAKQPGAPGVTELIARKQYARAIEMLDAQVRERPRDTRIRLQLADTFILAGRNQEAVPLLRKIADELAAEGFAAKSIAILKRIQKLEPQAGVEDQLASMIQVKHKHTEATLTRMQSPFYKPAPKAPVFGMEEAYEPTAVDMDTAPTQELSAIDLPAASAGVDLDAPMVATPLFPDFSKEELAAVIKGLQLVSFEAGDVVVAEGEPGDSLFIISTGTIKAWVRDPQGAYKRVRTLLEGDFFGEISILSGKPRSATVTAATRLELLELDRASLDKIALTHPRVLEVLQSFYQQRAGSEDERRIRSGSRGEAPA